MRADVVAVCFDDLARHGRRIGHRQDVQETQVGRLQMDLQCVAVDDFEAGDRRVVIELAGLPSLLARFVGADDLAFEHPQPRRLDRGIEDALQAVGMIGRRQFAQLALKCGVGREENALPDFHRVCLAVFLHQGHRFQRARHELDGPCEVVVVEHRLHYVGEDAVGCPVGRERWIEAGFGDRKRHVQRLAGVGGIGRCNCQRTCKKEYVQRANGERRRVHRLTALRQSPRGAVPHARTARASRRDASLPAPCAGRRRR